MRRVWLASVVAAVGLVVIPPSASGATQIGQTFDPVEFYPADHTVFQSLSPGSGYRVPSDGVITRWSTFADEFPPELKFKVGRPAPGADLTADSSFTVVGESAVEAPVAGLNSYFTRIPVKTGDVIGFYTSVGGNLAGPFDEDYTDHFEAADVLPGQSASFDAEHFQLDVSALLEPDCDNDGFGDETQDTDTSSCECKGVHATVRGTDGPDEILGTANRDVIAALGGRDEVSGLAGKDLICGGSGKDTLKGGKDKDKLYGQGGKDKLRGGGGKDRCVGGKKDDTAKKCEVEKSI